MGPKSVAAWWLEGVRKHTRNYSKRAHAHPLLVTNSKPIREGLEGTLLIPLVTVFAVCDTKAVCNTTVRSAGMHFVPELIVKRGAPLAIVWRAAHGQLKGVSKRDRERVRLLGSTTLTL